MLQVIVFVQYPNQQIEEYFQYYDYFIGGKW